MSYPDYPLVNELNKMLDEADTFKELDDVLLYYDNLVDKYGKVTGHYGNKLSDGSMDCMFGEKVCNKVQKAYDKLEYMRMVLDGSEQELGTIKWSDEYFQNRLKALDSDYTSSEDEGEIKSNNGGSRRRRKSKKRKIKKKKKTRKKRKKRKTRKNRKLRKKKKRKTNRK